MQYILLRFYKPDKFKDNPEGTVNCRILLFLIVHFRKKVYFKFILIHFSFSSGIMILQDYIYTFEV